MSGTKKIRNHSTRKHLFQKLSETNVTPNQIMQITGHKIIQSINNYSSINKNQHRSISTILLNSKPRKLNYGSDTFNWTQNHLLQMQLIATQIHQTPEAPRLLISQRVSKIFWIGRKNTEEKSLVTFNSTARKTPRLIYDTDSWGRNIDGI